MICACKTGCSNDRYDCVKLQLPCSPLCKTSSKKLEHNLLEVDELIALGGPKLTSDERQLRGSLYLYKDKHTDNADINQKIIAFHPVWAIG